MKAISPKKELEILHNLADITNGTMDLPELLNMICKMIVKELMVFLIMGHKSCPR